MLLGLSFALLFTGLTGFSASLFFAFFILLLLLIASAVVSGSETAFFSLKPNDISELSESDSGNDKLILAFREQPKVILATILIANNLVNVAIIILSTFITDHLFDFSENPVLAFVIQIIVVTSLILLIGEIIPKVIATRHPLKLTRRMALPLRFLVAVFKPFSFLLVNSTGFLDKRLQRKSYNLSMSELAAAIDITSDESTPPEEKKMLKGIATFNEKEVSSIMKPRIAITAIEKNAAFSTVISLIQKTGFSRIPVFEGSIDKVIGLLYIKDLLPYLEKEKVDWPALIRPSFYVPENKRINDLLQEFRQKKIHLAIVVDEYGGTAGLISLEDILEEIVGEISDEFDKDTINSYYKQLDDEHFMFNATTNLLDFCKIMDCDAHHFDEVRGDSDTLAGLILEAEGKIPEKGMVLKISNFEFEIADADKRRIKQIKTRKLPENEE